MSEFTYFLTAYPASRVVQCPSVNFLPFFLILCGTLICEAEVQLPALCHVLLDHAWYLQWFKDLCFQIIQTSWEQVASYQWPLSPAAGDRRKQKSLAMQVRGNIYYQYRVQMKSGYRCLVRTRHARCNDILVPVGKGRPRLSQEARRRKKHTRRGHRKSTRWTQSSLLP